MSRVGNRIINIPTGVTVNVDGNIVTVKGPKGELSTVINKNISVEVSEASVKVTRKNDNFKNFHGTANANIQKLEAVGVGYRFQVKGKELVVSAGYSNPVKVKVPEGITLDSPSNTELFVKGIDKQLVGQFAAEVRSIRKPEPYKEKGIRYADEHIRRKEGKKASK